MYGNGVKEDSEKLQVTSDLFSGGNNIFGWSQQRFWWKCDDIQILVLKYCASYVCEYSKVVILAFFLIVGTLGYLIICQKKVVSCYNLFLG